MKMYKFIVNIFLLSFIFLVPVNAEYFETDITVRFTSEFHNQSNNTYSLHNITVITENPGNSFNNTGLTNTSEFEQTFTLTIWRELRKNETELENITNRLREEIDCLSSTKELEYLRGINMSIDSANKTFQSFFQNVNYKSQFETCQNSITTLNQQVTTATTEKEKAKDNNMVVILGVGAIGLGLGWTLWGKKFKTNRPGEGDFPDSGGLWVG